MLRSTDASSIFPVSSNIFSSLMESWCNVLMENQSFWSSRKFGRHNCSTNPLHILYIYKQTFEHVSKRASLQAGGLIFLTVKSRKNLMITQPSDIIAYLIGPYYSPPLFPTTAKHCSLHYYLNPHLRLREMRRKLRFPR